MDYHVSIPKGGGLGLDCSEVFLITRVWELSEKLVWLVSLGAEVIKGVRVRVRHGDWQDVLE